MTQTIAPARRIGGRQTRREEVLRTALTLFATRGFDATSVRDIAEGCGMLSGSLYYHFASKEELYAILHTAAVDALIERVSAAIDPAAGRWDQLGSAVRAHLDAILSRDENALLVMTPLSPSLDRVREAIIASRDAYENLFRTIIDELELAPDLDRTMFRLTLVGAINWAHTWYRPGRMAPVEIADAVMAIARRSAVR